MNRRFSRSMRLTSLALLVSSLSFYALFVRLPLAASSPDFVAGDLIVGLRDGDLNDLAAKTLADAPGARLVQLSPALRAMVVRVPENELEATRTQLARNPDVRYVERNAIVQPQMEPNDPLFGAGQWGPQAIEGPAAWDLGVGVASTIVAVIDSGLDLTHPEFAGRILPGYDFANEDDDPMDDVGHGTHVAGIIGAAVNNNLGVAGVAGGVSLMPVKVLDADGLGTSWWLAQGIVWAADHGARVANVSIGAAFASTYVADALQYASDRNMLVVAAAGNGGNSTPVYPAWFPLTVAVSALRDATNLATYATYGDAIDLAAPGSSVLSTCLQSAGNAFCSMSGSSMAAPHVTGVAALVWSRNPDLTHAQVRTLLEETATNLGDPLYFGHGRVSAAAAVMAAPAPSLKIGDRVWFDSNRNGIQDSGETGLANVAVNLLTGETCGGAVTARTTTDAAGLYLFDGLAPGVYCVQVDPSNFARRGVLQRFRVSPPDRGGDDTLDSDGNANYLSPPVWLNGAGGNLTVDFGFWRR